MNNIIICTCRYAEGNYSSINNIITCPCRYLTSIWKGKYTSFLDIVGRRTNSPSKQCCVYYQQFIMLAFMSYTHSLKVDDLGKDQCECSYHMCSTKLFSLFYTSPKIEKLTIATPLFVLERFGLNSFSQCIVHLAFPPQEW